MPRFVLLLHACPRDQPRKTHCDLMLEREGVLQTWALAKLPKDWRRLDVAAEMLANSNQVEAERLANHRLAYLDYEGPVSGDRGTVRRLDSGDYRAETVPERFALDGGIVRGEIEFVPLPGDGSKQQLTFRPVESLNDL